MVDRTGSQVRQQASLFVATAIWRYARTMPQWPHEYTVKDWRPDLVGEFEWFCRLIATEGHRRPWPEHSPDPRYHNAYLVLGDHEYWPLGPNGDQDPPEGMTVINRQTLVDRERASG